MKLLQAPEVAELLGLSQQRVYDLARNGIIPAVRLGRQLRFDEDELAIWIKGGGSALPGGWRRESPQVDPA